MNVHEIVGAVGLEITDIWLVFGTDRSGSGLLTDLNGRSVSDKYTQRVCLQLLTHASQ